MICSSFNLDVLLQLSLECSVDVHWKCELWDLIGQKLKHLHMNVCFIGRR